MYYKNFMGSTSSAEIKYAHSKWVTNLCIFALGVFGVLWAWLPTQLEIMSVHKCVRDWVIPLFLHGSPQFTLAVKPGGRHSYDKEVLIWQCILTVAVVLQKMSSKKVVFIPLPWGQPEWVLCNYCRLKTDNSISLWKVCMDLYDEYAVVLSSHVR